MKIIKIKAKTANANKEKKTTTTDLSNMLKKRELTTHLAPMKIYVLTTTLDGWAKTMGWLSKDKMQIMTAFLRNSSIKRTFENGGIQLICIYQGYETKEPDKMFNMFKNAFFRLGGFPYLCTEITSEGCDLNSGRIDSNYWNEYPPVAEILSNIESKADTTFIDHFIAPIDKTSKGPYTAVRFNGKGEAVFCKEYDTYDEAWNEIKQQHQDSCKKNHYVNEFVCMTNDETCRAILLDFMEGLTTWQIIV